MCCLAFRRSGDCLLVVRSGNRQAWDDAAAVVLSHCCRATRLSSHEGCCTRRKGRCSQFHNLGVTLVSGSARHTVARSWRPAA